MSRFIISNQIGWLFTEHISSSEHKWTWAHFIHVRFIFHPSFCKWHLEANRSRKKTQRDCQINSNKGSLSWSKLDEIFEWKMWPRLHVDRLNLEDAQNDLGWHWGEAKTTTTKKAPIVQTSCSHRCGTEYHFKVIERHMENEIQFMSFGQCTQAHNVYTFRKTNRTDVSCTLKHICSKVNT